MRSFTSTAVVLASITTAVQATVRLADFQPYLTDLSGGCQSIYSTNILRCGSSDFSGSGCSSDCIAGLQLLAPVVQSACGNAGISGDNVVSAFLSGTGITKLCPNAPASSPSATSQQQYSSAQGQQTSSSTQPSATSDAPSSTSETSSSTSTQDSATSSPSSSSSTSTQSSALSSSTSSAVIIGMPIATSSSSSTSTQSSSAISSSAALSSSAAFSYSPTTFVSSTQASSSSASVKTGNGGSGGGSPFDNPGGSGAASLLSSLSLVVFSMLTALIFIQI